MSSLLKLHPILSKSDHIEHSCSCKRGSDPGLGVQGVSPTAYFVRGVAKWHFLFGCLLLSLTACTRPPAGPSVVVIVVDTLRADRVGALRQGQSLTPTLDALSKRSLTFDRAVAAAPLTMPSIAALFTGLYPYKTGVTTHSQATRLAVASPTLAESARAAGYRTAAVISNPWLANSTTGFDRGFDVYATRRSLRLGNKRLDARLVTDVAIEMVEDTTQPLLLWAHYIDTHMPYSPAERDMDALGLGKGTGDVLRDFEAQSDRETLYFDPPYSDAQLDETRQVYDAAVRTVDREIGRLLAAVDRELGSDTIIVFTADHGESLGDHGLYFAHDFTLYEELVHVPLLVRLPRVRDTRSSATVSLVDVFPTICEHSPLQCPPDLDGVSLSDPGARGRAAYSLGPPWRPRYSRNPFIRVPGDAGRWSALTEGNLKLIRIPTMTGIHWEAFDLRNDPDERADIFDARAHASSIAQLESWLASQRSAAPADESMRAQPWDRRQIEEIRSLGYLD